MGDSSDIIEIERNCDIVYGGNASGAIFEQSHQALLDFRERDDAWTFCERFIDQSPSKYVKFYGVQILLDLVRLKWAILEPDIKTSIRDFVSGHAYNWSLDEEVDLPLINQIDLVFVEIILKEWPQEWPEIVDELISYAASESATCQNNLKVISMLSQQVFDFGSQEMTSTRISQVSAALNDAAPSVFELIENVLSGTQEEEVLKTALEAFRYIVKWLDPHFIFETQLLEALCNSFLTNPVFQPYVLSIIGEITSKQNLPDEYTKSFPMFFDDIISALSQTISEDNIEELCFDSPEVIKSVIFTLSSFLSTYGNVIEEANDFDSLGTALVWINEIMKITETDNFKSCCELWRKLIRRYYLEKNANTHDFYNEFFPTVRRIMITRMERPVDILIVENEDGSFEKETSKNSAQVEHYTIMKDCLVFLSNIDPEDTGNAISEKIDELNQEWSYATLNSICWSSGAISGTFSYNDEKQFVIMILRELLQFSANEQASQEDKAMIASGIMFVCSSYPRFLTVHPAFLKTIENKLFDFMQNDFPGVKEMAVDSFTKIAEKCKSKFLLSDAKGEPAFIDYLIVNFDGITSDLSNELKAEMVKAMAIIISGSKDEGSKSKLTHDLMDEMNKKWEFQINQFNNTDLNCLINVLFFLRCNMYVADKVAMSYHVQFQAIFDQIIDMYGRCCATCSEMIEENEANSNADIFRISSQIKSTIIQILIKFTNNTINKGIIRNTILPPIIQDLLDEYENSNPYCKIPELLTLLESIIYKVDEQSINPFMNQIMSQLYKPSVDLICDDYDSFIEFRIPITHFMQAVVKKAFTSFIELPEDLIVLFVNTIQWGCQHPTVDVCKDNIDVLTSLFSAVEDRRTPQAFKNQFYESFYISTLDTIFTVMTDTIHKYAFIEQCKLLKKLFSLQIEQRNGDTIVEMLDNKFANRQTQFFISLVQQLFDAITDYNEFVNILRDFLVEVKQIANDDPDLYVDERNAEISRNKEIDRQIPGMTGPAAVNEYQEPEDDDLEFFE